MADELKQKFITVRKEVQLDLYKDGTSFHIINDILKFKSDTLLVTWPSAWHTGKGMSK